MLALIFLTEFTNDVQLYLVNLLFDNQINLPIMLLIG